MEERKEPGPSGYGQGVVVKTRCRREIQSSMNHVKSKLSRRWPIGEFCGGLGGLGRRGRALPQFGDYERAGPVPAAG